MNFAYQLSEWPLYYSIATLQNRENLPLLRKILTKNGDFKKTEQISVLLRVR